MKNSDFVSLLDSNTEQSVLFICRYLLRMSLSFGWNLFCVRLVSCLQCTGISIH